MSKLSIVERVQLVVARVEILKLMADDYQWQVHTPEFVRNMLEETLKEIDELLK